jgi:signal transduction histidine kinase
MGIALTHGGVLVAGGSFVGRFRRAGGVERQQLRWVAFGAVVAAVAVVGAFASALANQDLLLDVAAAALVTVLPLSVTIAISRYRLYDLDRIISRSLLYSALTAMVAATYVAVVAGLGLVAGSDRVVSGIAAVVAAMVVAPMRLIAQRGVDRLLFGRRAEPFEVVSGLSQRLQASASPGTALQALVDAIATDLRLPFVRVESSNGGVLAVRGDSDTSGHVRLALSHQGENVGALVLGLRRGEDEFVDRERALLEDLARHAGAAVHAAAVVRDLHLARHRLVATREEERRRLRRDLHDGLGPQLTAVTLKLDAARNLLSRDRERADAVLIELRADVKAAIDDIRRVVYALRPPGLDDLGLLGALRQHARASASGDVTPEITVTGADLDGLPAPVEVAAYRIATEAITNAVRHANARHCQVNVELDVDLTVEVVDDGVGLPSRWKPGVGITSMRERAGELGGSCALECPDGMGTKVIARLPLVAAAP